MGLAKRLAAIAAYVPEGSVAADIGTDHAYLPVFLVEEGICARVIATDIKQGPFASAQRRIEEAKLTGKIDLRLGNGLDVLQPGETEVLVLSGMGGNTIREILAAAPHVTRTVSRLVLQPMADPGDLRTWLAANGWRISDESLVEDGGKIYIVIMAEPGQEETRDPFLLELGPRLLEKKDPLLGRYAERIAGLYEQVLAGLECANSDAAREKALEIKTKLSQFRGIAGCL